MMIGINLSQLLRDCTAGFDHRHAVDCYDSSFGTLFVFILHKQIKFIMTKKVGAELIRRIIRHLFSGFYVTAPLGFKELMMGRIIFI